MIWDAEKPMNKMLNNKIIGFTISKKEFDHIGIDIFNTNLSTNKIQYNHLYIYLCGIYHIWYNLDTILEKTENLYMIENR